MKKAISPILIIVLISTISACSSNTVPPGTNMPVKGTFYESQGLRDFFTSSGGFDMLPKEYYIGIGDRLDIIFPIQRELNTVDIVVRRDGKISLPYLGDEMAAGRTPMGLDSVLTGRYTEYLKTPELSVVVRNTPDKLVYVLGQVRDPGGYATNLDVSLLQAISLAGGFYEGAKRDHVVVIRRMSPDRVIGVEINVKEILEGTAIQNDIMLRDYDIVYVPKTRLQNATEIALLVYDLVKTPTSLITTGWFAINLYTAYEYYKDKN